MQNINNQQNFSELLKKKINKTDFTVFHVYHLEKKSKVLIFIKTNINENDHPLPPSRVKFRAQPFSTPRIFLNNKFPNTNINCTTSLKKVSKIRKNKIIIKIYFQIQEIFLNLQRKKNNFIPPIITVLHP